jgi:Flp pilus assembly protein TadB
MPASLALLALYILPAPPAAVALGTGLARLAPLTTGWPLAALLAGASLGGWLVWQLPALQRPPSLARRLARLTPLPLGVAAPEPEAAGTLAAGGRALRRVAAGILGRLGVRTPDDLATTLALVRPEQTVADHYTLSMAAAGGGLAVGLLVARLAAVAAGLAPLVAGGAAALGFLIPELLLRRAVAGFRARLAHELPEAVGSLLILLAANRGLSQALGTLAQRPGSLVGRECRLILTAVTARGATLAEALEGRIGVPGVGPLDRLYRAIANAERYGYPLRPTLAKLAADLRKERHAAMIRRSKTASFAMLLPMLVAIFPAALIALLVPLLVDLFRTLR